MILNGKTVLNYIDGQGSVKTTRPLGRVFNALVRKNASYPFQDAAGVVIVPSKGASWAEVAKLVREGKSTQGRTTAKKGSKSSPVATTEV